MAIETYEKGTWRAEVDIEEHADGKFQGLVVLFQNGKPASGPAVQRPVDVSDTPDGALTEARLLAHRILGDLE
jgi:hypothetical protein